MIAVWKTYAAAGVIILHQAAKLAGIDFEQSELSDAFDAVFAAAAILFRIFGNIKAQIEIKKALYTPVPATEPVKE